MSNCSASNKFKRREKRKTPRKYLRGVFVGHFADVDAIPFSKINAIEAFEKIFSKLGWRITALGYIYVKQPLYSTFGGEKIVG